MRYVWLVVAFVGILAVGLLVGVILGRGGGGEQGSAASSPRTVTVEKTVPAQTSSPTTTSSPATGSAPATTPNGSGGSLENARTAFEQAVEGYGNPNLEVAEVMEFANNYYAEVKEKDTGIGAMELLINRPGSRVYPEPGPNMMWNTKYGMMSGGRGMGGMMGPNGGGMMGPGGRGMMGGYSSASPRSSQGNATNDKMPVSSDRARKIADAYLSRVSPGTKAEEPTRFYGYYTIDTEKKGETTGMLSVNGYSGGVWYHTWHGPFIAKQEED
jgi:hypothetical protein